MATQTPNLGLNKPADGEFNYGQQLRANMDTLDSAVANIRTTQPAGANVQIAPAPNSVPLSDPSGKIQGAWVADVEKRITQTIKIGGDVNHLYPVWWRMRGNVFGETKIIVHREFNLDKRTPVANLVGVKDGVRVGALLLELEGNSVVWGSDAKHMQIKRYHERYGAQLCSHVAFAMHGADAAGVANTSPLFNGLYLRGGGLSYHITHNGGMTSFGFNDGSKGVANTTLLHTSGATTYSVKPKPIASIQVPVGSVLPGFVSV